MAGNPPPPPPEPDLLFMKQKLSRRDVFNGAGVLSEMVVETCHAKMLTVLQKLVQERRYFFVPIRAEDPMGVAYELRFAINADGHYVVYDRWGDVVAINGLREGDTVTCMGHFAGDDREIHGATLSIHRGIPDSKFELPLILPAEMPAPEYIRDAGGSPRLLFEKILDGDDDVPFGELRFFRLFNRSLRMALEETPRLRVSTVNQDNENVELTRLGITRHASGDSYVINQAWPQVMSVNLLKRGDTVRGHGNPVGRGQFRLQLYVLRDMIPAPDAQRGKRRMPDEGLKTEEERKKVGRKRRKEQGALLTLLLLESGSETVLGRVVFKSTGKEQAEVVVATEVKTDDSDDSDDAGGFAMFSVEHENGSTYVWSEKVDENGVSKSVGGAVVGNDKARVSIDVYKSRY